MNGRGRPPDVKAPLTFRQYEPTDVNRPMCSVCPGDVPAHAGAYRDGYIVAAWCLAHWTGRDPGT